MSAQPTPPHDTNTPPKGVCLVLIEQVFVPSLETLECSNPKRVYAFGWHKHENRLIVYRPDCKLWSCPECAIKNRKRWVARIAFGAASMVALGCALTFFTISHNEYQTADEIWAAFPANWNKLYGRMKRAYPRLKYALVPEIHKSGKPHFHVLTNFEPPAKFEYKGKMIDNTRVKASGGDYLMWKWYKHVPRECGFGYMNDAQVIAEIDETMNQDVNALELNHDVVRAAGYVAKYLGKNSATAQLPSGVRRIRVSNNFPQLPEIERDYAADEYVWTIAKDAETAARILERAHNLRTRITRANTGEIVL